MTNYERIKQMNVIDMAEFLDTLSGVICPPHEKFRVYDCCGDGKCTGCWKEWLEMEVEK